MKLTLRDNITVSMHHIHQWVTYGGLIEGTPTRRMNTNIINALGRRAKQYCYSDQVYVIEPEQKPIYKNHKNLSSEAAKLELPVITCIARFEYFKALRDKEMDFSYMIIEWFQDTYAFPIIVKIHIS